MTTKRRLGFLLTLWDSLSDEGKTRYIWYAVRLMTWLLLMGIGIALIAWRQLHGASLMDGTKLLLLLCVLGWLIAPPWHFWVLLKEAAGEVLKS